jgi:glycerophosphoryl diester phosphodiesterase
VAAPDWLTARPIAHRGYHDRSRRRVENTMSAITAALARRFAVEIDLRLTGDEQVVGFHDSTLERLTEGHGRVDGLTLTALRTIRLHDSDDRIPTLDEILEEVAGRTPLVLELKSERSRGGHLENAVARSLAGYAGPVAVMSFDPRSVSAMRHLAPHLPRGLVADRFASEEWPSLSACERFAGQHLLTAVYVLPHFIAYDIAALPASAPLALRHFFGLPLLTWTVKTPAERTVANRWADQIIFEDFDPDKVRDNA